MQWQNLTDTSHHLNRFPLWGIERPEFLAGQVLMASAMARWLGHEKTKVEISL